MKLRERLRRMYVVVLSAYCDGLFQSMTVSLTERNSS